RPAPRGEAGPDRLGAGALHLRRDGRRRDRETAVRPLLHQEHVDRTRPVHRLRDHQDRAPPERAVSRSVVNAMTIDVEDYFHVSVFDGLVPRHAWEGMESRVCANTERLLEMFDEANVQATFFILGWVAERYPRLVRAIAEQGHEIASHGYGHRLVYDLTPRAFREDVRRAKDLLETTAGERVYGYRAPSYSVTPKSLWALDVLIEEGYTYDASIFPIHHDRYGI